MSFSVNPLHACDSYKLGHKDQYPEGTNLIYSNFTPRSAKHFQGSKYFDNKIVWVGFQGVVQEMHKMWRKKFFKKPLHKALKFYQNRISPFVGKAEEEIDVSHIASLHKLGFLPIEIKAIKEGARVNIGVPVFTVVNTHPEFYWLTNYIETYLSAESWKTPTAATIAYEYKRIFLDAAERTGSPKEFVAVQGHDFSNRGMSGFVDAARTGIGHQASFIGSDSISSVDYISKYYGSKSLIACSVPATEHSVMCMGGKETEIETFRRLITQVYPEGIVSIVSDTWDFWQVIIDYAVQLKEEILSRKPNAMGLAKVVFRPDSGNPADIICGDPKATPGSPEYKGAIECLWEIFGGTHTNKGYKVLNERVGLIYGDSITIPLAQEIMDRLADKGFASCNVVLGIGSYTYQYITRDTFGFAMKATYGEINFEPQVIFKQPKTDPGKNSAKGLLRVEKEGGNYVLYDNQSWDGESEGELQTVYVNGYVHNWSTWDDVRNMINVNQ